jgi:hypothetical protein
MSSKSGAQKRKEKAHRDLESHAQKIPKLTQFFVGAAAVSAAAAASIDTTSNTKSEQQGIDNETNKNNDHVDTKQKHDSCNVQWHQCTGPPPSSISSSSTAVSQDSYTSQSQSHVVKPFVRPHVSSRLEFMDKHPIQPIVAGLPFSAGKASFIICVRTVSSLPNYYSYRIIGCTNKCYIPLV